MEERILFTDLLDWLEGRLPDAEAQRLAAAVAADVTLQEEVAWIKHFLQAGSRIVLAEPPPALRRRLQMQFRQQTLRKRARQAWHCIQATLSFDSHTQPATAGLRGAPLEQERQLIYTTSIADVALNLHPRPEKGQFDLLGQILPHTAEIPLFSVQLLSAGQERGMAISDELGEFTFTSLPPGLYQLIVCGDDAELMITPLNLSL